MRRTGYAQVRPKEQPMPIIEAENLSKVFHTVQKEPGKMVGYIGGQVRVLGREVGVQARKRRVSYRNNSTINSRNNW